MTISIEHLDFSYGRLPVLRDITATAAARRITAVIGPNAVGKSTLLRCVIGALRPANGRVLVNGRDVRRLSPRALARQIAYVPQRSIVSAAFTVRQVVELGRYALPASESRVREAIGKLDLSQIEQRPYPELSAGQQQRVALARAYAQVGPDGHLILDEPTAAMDLRYIASSIQVLRELADGGATIVLALHDLSLAASVADDVWLLREGRIEASGPVEEILDLERLESIFGVGFEWARMRTGRARLVPQSPVERDMF